MFATRSGSIIKHGRVIKHHHSEGGRVLSRNQEELILIGAVGAFWLGIPFFKISFVRV